MPLYEYECADCHRHTEKIQKFSDAEITICPHCGGKLERVISAPAISFKGGGWYKDLYSSAKPATASGDGGSKDGANKDSGGSDKAATSDPAATSAPAAASTPVAAPASAPSTAASSKD